MTFDEIRAAYPELAVTLYALEPGGPVTLEVIAPDGQTYTFAAETADAAIEMAWPSPVLEIDPVDRVDCPNTGLPCLPRCDGRTCAGLYVPLDQWPGVSAPEPNVFD